jgi:hypothetical protein
MLHVLIGEILANMTQVRDVAPGVGLFLALCHASEFPHIMIIAAWYMSYTRGIYVNCWNHAVTLFIFILLSFIFNKWPFLPYQELVFFNGKLHKLYFPFLYLYAKVHL